MATAKITPAQFAAGLRQLAAFIETHPDLPDPIYLRDPAVWCPSNAGEVAAIIRAAKASGLAVEKQYSETQRNVAFVLDGGMKVFALVSKVEVCERVVVGQKVELVPDPAYVPPEVPMVERIVDVTEWRCRPLLAPQPSSPAVAS